MVTVIVAKSILRLLGHARKRPERNGPMAVSVPLAQLIASEVPAFKAISKRISGSLPTKRRDDGAQAVPSQSVAKCLILQRVAFGFGGERGIRTPDTAFDRITV